MSIIAVAKRAGVSVATVSRVINDLGSVRSETADQVRAAMREIGYTPPVFRRGPRGRRRVVDAHAAGTGQIAILNVGGVHDWLHLPIMGSVVSGAMRACKELELRAMIDEMPDPSMPSSLITRNEVDGAIVFLMSGVEESSLDLIRQRLPIIRVMGGDGATYQSDHVTANNTAIGRLAFDYLKRSGCARVAYLTDRPELGFMRLRGTAFSCAAHDAGIEAETIIVSSNASSRKSYVGHASVFASLSEAAEHIATQLPRIDGLFLPTDYLTATMYPILQRLGVNLEADVTIISCDNERVRLEGLSPRPASIDIRAEEIGRMAVRSLVHRLDHPQQPFMNVLITPTIPTH